MQEGRSQFAAAICIKTIFFLAHDKHKRSFPSLGVDDAQGLTFRARQCLGGLGGVVKMQLLGGGADSPDERLTKTPLDFRPQSGGTQI